MSNNNKELILSVEVNLDDVWSEEGYGMVGQIIREELKLEIKSQIKKALKGDRKFAQLIRAYKDRAIQKALESVDG